MGPEGGLKRQGLTTLPMFPVLLSIPSQRGNSVLVSISYVSKYQLKKELFLVTIKKLRKIVVTFNFLLANILIPPIFKLKML